MPHVAAHQAAFRLARSCSFSSSCSICFLIFSFSLLSRFRARSFSSSRWSMNFLMYRSRMQRRSLSILSVGSSFCSRRKRACNCFISCWVVRGRRAAVSWSGACSGLRSTAPDGRLRGCLSGGFKREERPFGSSCQVDRSAVFVHWLLSLRLLTLSLPCGAAQVSTSAHKSARVHTGPHPAAAGFPTFVVSAGRQGEGVYAHCTNIRQNF